jgi:hypothetical protein
VGGGFVLSAALNRNGVVEVGDETSINILASLWAENVSRNDGKEIPKA